MNVDEQYLHVYRIEIETDCHDDHSFHLLVSSAADNGKGTKEQWICLLP